MLRLDQGIQTLKVYGSREEIRELGETIVRLAEDPVPGGHGFRLGAPEVGNHMHEYLRGFKAFAVEWREHEELPEFGGNGYGVTINKTHHDELERARERKGS